MPVRPNTHHSRQFRQSAQRHQYQFVALQSSNYDVDDASDSEEEPDQQQQNADNLLVRYLPEIRTAVVSFCAGSLATVLGTMVLFQYSLMKDDTIFESAGLDNRPTISTPNTNANIAAKDKQSQKRQAVALSSSLYRQILQELDETYVDNVDNNLLFETTTRAMLNTLDPYTEYISPQDLMKRQKLVGIGAFVMKEGSLQDTLGGKSVSSLLSRVPSAVTLPSKTHLGSKDNRYRVILSLEGLAYGAGLRVGDELLEIDDQPVEDSLEEVRGMLTGDLGTTVKLTIRRPGIDKVQALYVERKPVQFSDVPYSGTLASGDIGFIKLHRFGLDTGLKVKEAIQKIQSDNEMKGLILDLRDNSGGELISAVQTSSLFFPEGTYLGSSKGKGSLYPTESYYSGRLDIRQYGYKNEDDFTVRNNGKTDILDFDGTQLVDTDKTKIVIITNKQTASAAEFLAGALQDLDKAVVIGTDGSSFGKGIGQRELPLPNGGALKLTYHEFYTPSGRCVQRVQQQRTKQLLQKKQNEIFYTKNGRQLADRKGIEVDEKVNLETSLLSSLLSSSGAYFDFATDYCSKQKVDTNNFAVDDSIYNSFKRYVQKEQRSGNLKLEDAFDNDKIFATLFIKSKLYDKASFGIKNLRDKVVTDLLNDFDSTPGKDSIRRELEQNILARELPDSDLLQRSFDSDATIKEAVKIIGNQERYNQILRGKTG